VVSRSRVDPDPGVDRNSSEVRVEGRSDLAPLQLDNIDNT
jgi:hypothetical protein